MRSGPRILLSLWLGLAAVTTAQDRPAADPQQPTFRTGIQSFRVDLYVTRDGEPVAALVSMEDYARLQENLQAAKPDEKLSWQEWSSEARQLREDILAFRDGRPVNLDAVIRDVKGELEDRDAYQRGS